MFPKYFIIHSIILTCQKLEINRENTILLAKRNPNIVIIFYSRRQLGTTEPGNTNGGGLQGRNIVPIMLQTSTNTKSVFCKNLTID